MQLKFVIISYVNSLERMKWCTTTSCTRREGNRSKRLHFLPKRPHFFSKINHYKQKKLCDSNVYKCLPTIRFCSNILFLFYYIFIKLFIKVINLINDDFALIKFICFINYYNNYMPLSVSTVFYELNYR